MKILAIETSCDDTGIAILEVSPKGAFNVLSNEVSSQIEVHKQYGGVFPMMAKREHQQNLVPVFEKALKEAKLLHTNSEFQISNKIRISELKNSKFTQNSKLEILNSILERESELFEKLKAFLNKYQKPDIDAIAIVNGPGLEPCLWVGVNFAKALSYAWDIPLVPVNHIESHILVNLLNQKETKKLFPALSLVVSGGHTQLILVKGVGKYIIVGETRDDAAGECFDKAAKILGLGYPGGPIISKIAAEVKESSITLPRPMMNSKDYDFSFSGLKTAVLYETKGKKLTKNYVGQVCFEVQEAIIDVLLKKTLQAVKDYKVKSIILGGGVSANKQLRAQFTKEAKKLKLPLLIPPAHLSTDNALMSAVTGYFHRNKKAPWKSIKADGNLRVGK